MRHWWIRNPRVRPLLWTLLAVAPHAAAASAPTNPLKKPTPASAPSSAPSAPTPSPSPSVSAPAAADATKLGALVKLARGASTKQAAAAWQKVLAVDPWHSEALFALGIAEASARRTAEVQLLMSRLAERRRPDAIEFLIEARYHKAMTVLREDAAFRKLIGIGTPAGTDYERLMAHGGTWEQAGTACDRAEVGLRLLRERSFALEVTNRCAGQIDRMTFRGRWALDDKAPGTMRLLLGAKGGRGPGTAESATGAGGEGNIAPCTLDTRGDELALRCVLDEDLVLELLPARRGAGW